MIDIKDLDDFDIASELIRRSKLVGIAMHQDIQTFDCHDGQVNIQSPFVEMQIELQPNKSGISSFTYGTANSNHINELSARMRDNYLKSKM